MKIEYISNYIIENTIKLHSRDLKAEVLIYDKVEDQNIGGVAINFPIPLLDGKFKTVEDPNIDRFEIELNFEGSKMPLSRIIEGMVYYVGLHPGEENDTYLGFLRETNKIQNSLVSNHALQYSLYLLNNDMKKEAAIFLIGGIRIFGESLDYLNLLGRCMYDMSIPFGELDDGIGREMEMIAKEVFESITADYPGFPDSYYYLGYIYTNLKNYEYAKECWKKALNAGADSDRRREIVDLISDNNAKEAFERGKKLVEQGFYIEALEALLPSYDLYSDWWELSALIGRAYRLDGKFELAVDFFKKSLEFNSGNIDALNELGICFASLDSYELSTRYFQEALNYDLDNSELLVNLAAAYFYMGNFPASEDSIDKALKKNPDDEIGLKWKYAISKKKSELENMTVDSNLN